MQEGARLSAAIEILNRIETEKRPPRFVLKDWGKAHRYAGSSDRAWISGLVMDSLRHKASAEWAMQTDKTRSLAFWIYINIWKNSFLHLETILEKDRFAPDLLSGSERSNLFRKIEMAPEWVKCNLKQEWYELLKPIWKEEIIDLGRSMSQRAEACLRINTLKTNKAKTLDHIAHSDLYEGKWVKDCLRLKNPLPFKRSPSLKNYKAWIKGWIEVQDEGAQLAALSVNARPSEHILDYCAGAGGKSLAMAAHMQKKGQIYAYDISSARMKDIWSRIDRARAHNIQVIESHQRKKLDVLKHKMDKVLIDVPCTGSGIWRRKPETKWKLNKNQFLHCLKLQEEILEQSIQYVRPGGYVIYVTCSLFYEENQLQIENFLEKHPEYTTLNVMEFLKKGGGIRPEQDSLLEKLCIFNNNMMLSPLKTDTDGFFIAVLNHRS